MPTLYVIAGPTWITDNFQKHLTGDAENNKSVTDMSIEEIKRIYLENSKKSSR